MTAIVPAFLPGLITVGLELQNEAIHADVNVILSAATLEK